MGSKVQAVLTPGPSHSSSPERGGNRTPELAETLATAASLRSREGGGGGLRSRGGPTYLVEAAVVVLVSGGGTGAESLGSAGS